MNMAERALRLLDSGTHVDELRAHFESRANVYSYTVGAIVIEKQDWDAWKRSKEMSVIQKPTRGDKPVEAPNCPDGHGRMRYNATDGNFVCGNVECKVIAKPKVTAENLKDTVLGGDIELIRQAATDGGSEVKWFLHLVQSRVMVDVTNVVDPDATGERHGMNGAWMVGLLFANGVREIEE